MEGRPMAIQLVGGSTRTTEDDPFLRTIRQRLSSCDNSGKPTKLPSQLEPVYKCQECKDVGYVYPADGENRMVRCGCQSNGDVERRRRYLEGIDGLLPQERERFFSDAMRV